MSTTEIDAARDALAAAEAEVDRLRARLRAELADQDAPDVSADDRRRRLGWADGVPPPPLPPVGVRPAAGPPCEPDPRRLHTEGPLLGEGGAFLRSG